VRIKRLREEKVEDKQKKESGNLWGQVNFGHGNRSRRGRFGSPLSNVWGKIRISAWWSWMRLSSLS